MTTKVKHVFDDSFINKTDVKEIYLSTFHKSRLTDLIGSLGEKDFSELNQTNILMVLNFLKIVDDKTRIIYILRIVDCVPKPETMKSEPFLTIFSSFEDSIKNYFESIKQPVNH